MNYKIITKNAIDCEIIKTHEKENKYDVFKSFTKAKKEYLKHLRISKKEWCIVIKEGLNIKKKDI
jgi:hypothetical protein